MGDEEREYLLKAFDSNWITTMGEDVDAFERELGEAIGMPQGLALSSGTAGLHLGLLALNVGAGDDVLVADLTFVATANAVAYTGAQPRFIDCDLSTWTIDAGLVLEEIADRARTWASTKSDHRS